MLSAVVYITLGVLVATVVERRRLKVYVLILSLLLTMVVGLSRVYLGVHYPTDVLAGWMAGLAWALLCWLVARWLQGRGTVERVIQPSREHMDLNNAGLQQTNYLQSQPFMYPDSADAIAQRLIEGRKLGSPTCSGLVRICLLLANCSGCLNRDLGIQLLHLAYTNQAGK